MEYFKDCKKLTRLGLNNTQMTDKGLAYFKDCEDLKELGQRGSNVTKEGVEDFQKAVPKCRIDIQPNQIIKPDTSEAPAAPKPGDDLASDRKGAEYVLSMGGVIRINDQAENIETVDALPAGPFRLTSITLKDNRVDDAGLSVFKGCKNLIVLNLWYTKVTDVGLSYFKDCKKLQQLVLRGTVIGSAGLANFEGCEDLAEINLHDAPNVGDKGLSYFTKCKKLNTLLLGRTQVTDTGLLQLKDCSSLKYLEIDLSSITRQATQELNKAIPACKIDVLPGSSGLPKAKPGSFVPMFNGKDLTGWKGLPDMWTVQNDTIIGSSVQNSIKFNTCLCTEKTYDDFELKCQLKLIGGAKANSGIQIRSKLLDAQKFIVEGPQCDAGAGYWGSLYGEGSGGMMQAADAAVVAEALKPDKFNELYIRCVGNRVTIKLNGVTTVDKEFAGLPASGIIGLQLHGGDAQMVEFKDIQIKELRAAKEALPAKNAPLLDSFLEKSVWKSIDRKLVLTVTERKGETFKARWVVGTNSVLDVSGTVKDGKFSWLAKDSKAVKGGASRGDYFGTVVQDQDGDRIDIKWQLGNQTGEFVLRKQPGN